MNDNTTSHPFTTGSSIVAYLRDSGGESQDLSICQQESAIQEWAFRNGLTITKIFKDEAKPGSSLIGREDFSKMIHYLRAAKQPEAGLVIWNYQRFSRSLDDSQFYRADIRRHGYLFYSLNDSIPEGPIGKLFEAIIDWKNEQFLSDLSLDVKRGLAHLVTAYGAVPGNPPAGFMREPIDVGKRRDGSPHIVHRWVPNPAAWEACKIAWQMRARRATLHQIHAATHLYPAINSYNTFFKNRLYLGELHYAGITITGYCEALIDQNTWDAVQSITVHRSTQSNPDHPRRANSTYLLSGLVHCALCGSAMVGHTISFKAKEQVYEYYQCSAGHRRHDCTAEQIPRQMLETVVMATIAGEIINPATIATHQTELDRTAESEATLIAAERAETNKRLAHTRRRLANVVETIAELGKSPALTEKLRALEAEQTELLAHLMELSADHRPPTLTQAQIDELSRQFVDLTTDPQRITDLHQALRSLVAKIVVERKERVLRGLITYYHPPEAVELSSNNLCLWHPPPVGAPSHRHKFVTSLNSKTTS
jgi:site-specific DNA recombinase